MLIKMKRARIFKKSIILFVSAFLILFSLDCKTKPQPSNEIQAKVDAYMNAHLKLKTFNGSILMAKGGKVLISKGYGKANYELDVPNTPQTKYRLGSLTKQFTAMAVMELQEKGLLNVSDPIKKYLPDYPGGDKITIHHLLTHTSGIPNFTSFPEYKKLMIRPLSVEEVIAKFKDKPLDFSPGEKFSYSNSGYILLGYLVEKISGKPYGEYVKENIFDPLNMKNTGYDYHDPIINSRAAGYSLNEGKLINASYIDMKIPGGAGGLYSTVEDLYLWDRALYTEKLVSQSSLKKMFKPFKDNYGYGWQIDKLFGHKRISHSGGINGFVTNISRYPDDDACIIVLSNLEAAHMGKINRDLAAILFSKPYELPKERKIAKVEPRIYNLYVGKYQLEENFFLIITKEDSRLFAQATGQGKAEIFPESETKFFIKIIDAQITFVKNDKGKVTKLILHQGGKDHSAKKIE